MQQQFEFGIHFFGDVRDWAKQLAIKLETKDVRSRERGVLLFPTAYSSSLLGDCADDGYSGSVLDASRAIRIGCDPHLPGNACRRTCARSLRRRGHDGNARIVLLRRRELRVVCGAEVACDLIAIHIADK